MELISLAASCEGGSNIISWSTASEQNNEYFVIEKSVDGSDFTAIGTLNGAGNSSTITHYQFTDSHTAGTGCYYRLRQHDYNGQEQISEKVWAAACGDAAVSVNAFTQGNVFRVDLKAAADCKFAITLFSGSGQIMSNAEFIASAGSNGFYLDNQSFSNGVYFLVVAGENFRQTFKLSLTR